MKFYTTEEYANLKGLDNSTIRKKSIKGELKTYSIAHPLSNLVLDEGIPKKTAIISLMNLKGGAGKTTISAHLAALLSKTGFKVLLVDTDHQNQCRFFFPEQPFEYSITDALSGKVPIEQCIYQTQTADSFLDIIYSSYGLTLFSARFQKEDRLKEIIDPIQDRYDFIIFDTAPSFDIININVAMVATHIIIPIMPQKLHIEGASHNFEALDKIAHVPVLNRVIGIILNIVNTKTAQHKAYIELLKEEYGSLIFDSFIPQDGYLPNVNDFHTNIFDYREKCKASQSLKKFTWETLRRI